MTLPGLPKKPAAYGIDVDDDGIITGLFQKIVNKSPVCIIMYTGEFLLFVANSFNQAVDNFFKIIG